MNTYGRNTGGKMKPRKCEVCGKMFKPKHHQQEYCGEKCWKKNIANMKAGK